MKTVKNKYNKKEKNNNNCTQSVLRSSFFFCFYSFTVRCDNFNVSFPIAGVVRSTRIIFNGLLSNVVES
jgi:hypothetical protein